MSLASENRIDPEDFTQSAGSSPRTQHSSPAMEYLIVIRKKSHIVKIFRPQEKHITIGRSSKNSITLSDPQLSRTAGEIILGPIPILRRKKNGQKSNDFISIHSGKPYHFKPYTLTLLEPGEIFLNRHKTNNRNKIILLWSLLFVILFFVTKSKISQFQGNTKAEEHQEKMSHLFSAYSEYNQDEKTFISDEMINHENIKSQAPTPSITVVSRPVSTPEVAPDMSKMVTHGKIEVASRTRQRKVTTGEKTSLYDTELDNAIQAAVLSVQQGDLEMAGRILNPLLPYADNNHRQEIIDILDPHIQALFKEAYMFKSYEPSRSREIMQNIAKSGLEMLPSYRKAKKSLGDKWNPRNGVSNAK